MLRLFAGRENTDKERFIYDSIRECGGETLVLVPDQYTLVAEEQALRYMQTDCLFDTEILSMSRLGLRLLTEQGTESVNMLDRYGRFMLLTRLIKEHAGDFDIFRRSAGKQAFASMLSDFISEFKQQECSIEEVEAMLTEGDADPILQAKLSELRGVIESYEEAVSGRYTDSEDYISGYIEAIGKSRMIRGKHIWIYGYDSITPKFTRAMLELAENAAMVNFVLNRSDFGLDEQMERMLRAKCREMNVPFSCEEISAQYETQKSETIRRIERGLWNDEMSGQERAANADFDAEDLTVVCAANPYYEAETAASYIWHLVRDLGYRMRDIQVIANDEGMMHPVIKRVFAEYGLPVFMDSARDITDTAPVSFIVDLLWFLVHGMNSQYLFALLKTGLAGIDGETIEDLENYVRTYHIRGSMWERDFRYGEDVLGAEAFRALNEVRRDVVSKICELRDKASVKKQKTSGDADKAREEESLNVAGFVRLFRDYLEDIWNLSSAVESMADEQSALGFNDEAQRTSESYDKAMDLLDQVTEIMGDARFDLAEFTEIYVAGLTNVEVGVIPPAADGLSVGTMIRTRPRPVRAAVILGANEGTLPMQPSTEGLFSVDEKEYFRDKGFALGALEDIKMREEDAAMYRMLSKPSDKLYISWSLADNEGSELCPSPLIDSLRTLFPCLSRPGRILRDVISAGWGGNSLAGGTVGDAIDRPGESMRHLIDRIKDRNVPEAEDPLERSLISWYSAKRSGELKMMLEAAGDENEQKPLGKDIAKKLFARSDGTLVLSASSIGGYFDCPFRFFIDRGLKPREERDFSSDPRSIGDAYHECLMSVARRLLGDAELRRRIAGEEAACEHSASADAKGTGAETQAAGAEDENHDKEEAYRIIEQMVDEELARIAENYQEGLFISTGSERFRMDRIREVCAGAARAMADQLSSESVVEAAFEESFSRTGRFSPVTLNVDGETVYVEGKIDRSDILSVSGSDRVRIIDYKTGQDSLNMWKMRNGYRMQLMIYMISASTGDVEPAGMFYFNIKDPIEGIDSKSAKQAGEIMSREPGDTYKLKGRYISEPGVLEAMPAGVLAGRSEKDRCISREEYEQARNDVIAQIEKTAAGIMRGAIDIHPFRDNGRLACSNCSYKPVCRRDREYTKNYAREIKPQPKEQNSDGGGGNADPAAGEKV